MSTRLQAPVTTTKTVSATYLGAGTEFEIRDATMVQVGFLLEGTPDTFVAGTLKIAWVGQGSIEIQIPAGNMYQLGTTSGPCLPTFFMDVKSDSGTPVAQVIATGPASGS